MGAIQAVDDVAKESTISEFLVTRTVIKEVYIEGDGTLNLKNESNQVAFVAGLLIALLVFGVAVLAVCLFMRHRSRA